MSHKTQRTAIVVLGVLAAAAIGATVLTRSWSSAAGRARVAGSASTKSGAVVDTRPLDVAQQLDQLAETRTEKSYAADAVRMGDYAVDFAFAAAIRQASAMQAPNDSATRSILTHRKSALDAVAADSARIIALTQQLTKGSSSAHDELQQQLDLAQAQLELDHDDADDAHEDLIRAGGDRLAAIQHLRAQHDSSEHATQAPAATATTAPPAPSIELTKSSSLLDQSEAWWSLQGKRQTLAAARQAAADRALTLATAHDTLERQVAAEKAQQQILHGRGHNAGNVVLSKSADTKRSTGAVDSLRKNLVDSASSATPLAFLQALTVDQKDLSELDKRVENEQDLAAVYANWNSYVHLRQQRFEHGLLVTLSWLFALGLIVVGANEAVQHLFVDAAQHRRLHTVRTVLLFAVQAGGIIGILVLVFGVPQNFATVLALAGAGLALALQDFIVGFFGWFVLMGKDGIRPGDWVEINGVGGEALEVGVFKTVLLETSDWSDAAAPTGRTVSFVNSFAIEGHYFNFSTSGQWLWDELDVEVSDGSDPYAIAEEMQRIAEKETSANSKEAEVEWLHTVPGRVRQKLSAAPSVKVKPSGASVSVGVRYLTRASERQEVRARVYKAVIALLHGGGAVAAPAKNAEESVP